MWHLRDQQMAYCGGAKGGLYL